MKHIIKVSDEIKSKMVTRREVELIGAKLNRADEYLFDMSDIEFITRSAADEFFNIAFCDYNVVLAKMEPFVKKMMDVVSVSRFKERDREFDQPDIIYCSDMESLSKCLLS